MTTSIGWTVVPDGSGGSKIGKTWNPQVGCRELSPGCRECYAAKLAHRGMSAQHRGLTVMRTNAAGEPLGVHWNGEINRVPGKLAEPLSWRKPSGIFVGSMTDIFFDVSTDDACRWIAAIFGIMAAAPQHTFMVLTKRPENAKRWFAWLDAQAEGMGDEAASAKVCLGAALDLLTAVADSDGNTKSRDKVRAAMRRDDLAWPLPGVWVGVTAEDQQRADLRVPVLLELPATERFVSYEPALGPVDWSVWLPRRDDRLEDERCPACDGDGVVPGSSCPSLRPDHDAVEKGEDGPECAECGDAYLDEDLCRECGGTGYIDLPSLDWVIAGGESGPGARPAHPDWFRSARDQCEAAGLPYFHKQNGVWAEVGQAANDTEGRPGALEWTHMVSHSTGRAYAAGEEMPIMEVASMAFMRKVGKDAAGRKLDGQTWDGFPE